MLEPEKYVIQCAEAAKIVAVMNAAMPQLPPETRKLLNKIKLHYLQLYGTTGLHERVNNRTVSRILAEYDPPHERTPIASGELDGIRYELFEVTDRKTPRQPGDSPPPADGS